MGMEKIDVAVQSYKKPELLFYTLLSLKKTCGNYISTIYIDDDCSDDGSITFFKSNIFVNSLLPIQVKVRENTKRSGYSTTIMTKALLKKKPFIPQLQTLLLLPLKHLSFHKTEDDIRYQWAINQTDKKYLLIIHDDIVFYDNVIEKYLDCFLKDKKLIIVGDLGGSKRCPFGPCGEKGCSPDLISSGYRPCLNWPITGTYGFPKNLLGRKKRNCRINEWLCMIDIQKARIIKNEEGICFGNYEFGGDVGTYWFYTAIQDGYGFLDPYPSFLERKKHYLHWWLGFEGHSVWVAKDGKKNAYPRDYIIQKVKDDFGIILK